MIFRYIFLVLLGAFPLWKTVRYILLEERVRKQGIATTGTVFQVHTTRYQRGPVNDRVHVRYNSIVPGQYHEASFVSKHGKYRSGQTVPVKYLPESPARIVVEKARGYWVMLVFSVVILMFVCFAVYKIDEMV